MSWNFPKPLDIPQKVLQSKEMRQSNSHCRGVPNVNCHPCPAIVVRKFTYAGGEKGSMW